VVEKKEITKYRGKHHEPVYLMTVIKQLALPEEKVVAER
jgi:hypothetical protein